MVKRKTLSAGYGINGWLQQRITAVIMLIAIFVVFGFVVLAAKVVNAEFISWQEFFSFKFVKICTSLTFAAVMLHAWIGMRDLWLDYVQAAGLRVLLHTLTILWLLGSLIYSLVILWA